MLRLIHTQRKLVASKDPDAQCEYARFFPSARTSTKVIAGIGKYDLRNRRTIPIFVTVRAKHDRPLKDKEQLMNRKRTSEVFGTMNAVERARASQGMHQALRLERLFSATVARVRNALGSAERAMTLVYGRPGR
ncbi:MAG TPA: hypothetical protein VKG21_02450 [Casimicrobiaceae bacterium]|nr:hypothetical protein [Casimicrobiaceae bacterium]